MYGHSRTLPTVIYTGPRVLDQQPNVRGPVGIRIRDHFSACELQIAGWRRATRNTSRAPGPQIRCYHQGTLYSARSPLSPSPADPGQPDQGLRRWAVLGRPPVFLDPSGLSKVGPP